MTWSSRAVLVVLVAASSLACTSKAAPTTTPKHGVKIEIENHEKIGMESHPFVVTLYTEDQEYVINCEGMENPTIKDLAYKYMDMTGKDESFLDWNDVFIAPPKGDRYIYRYTLKELNINNGDRLKLIVQKNAHC